MIAIDRYIRPLLVKDSIWFLVFYALVTLLFIVSTISNYGMTILWVKVMVGLASTLSVLKFTWGQTKYRPANNATLLFLAGAIFFVTSVFWSQNQLFGVIKAIHFTSFFVPVYLIINNAELLLHERELRMWSKVVIVSGFLIALWVLISNPISFEHHMFEVSIPFIGRLITYSIVILIAVHFDKYDLKFSSAMIIVLIGALFFVSFRAGILVVAIISCIQITYYVLNSKLKSAVALFLVVLLGYILGSLCSPNIAHRVSWMNDVVAGTQVQDISVSIRIEGAQLALEKWLSSPLWGVGIGGYLYPESEGSVQSILKYPHNLALEILSEGGLVTFFLFVLSVIAVMYDVIIRSGRKILRNEYIIGILQLTICALVLSMFSKDVTHNLVVFAFFLLVRNTMTEERLIKNTSQAQ